MRTMASMILGAFKNVNTDVVAQWLGEGWRSYTVSSESFCLDPGHPSKAALANSSRSSEGEADVAMSNIFTLRVSRQGGTARGLCHEASCKLRMR